MHMENIHNILCFIPILYPQLQSKSPAQIIEKKVYASKWVCIKIYESIEKLSKAINIFHKTSAHSSMYFFSLSRPT